MEFDGLITAVQLIEERRPAFLRRCADRRGRRRDLICQPRIDADCFQLGVAELRWQAGTGERFSVLSEEAGLIDLGAEYPRVVLDPVDGSTNASRGGLSAVGIVLSLLEGPTMGEVSTGCVFDVLTAREWTTVRAGGTLQDVRRVFTPPPPTSQK